MSAPPRDHLDVLCLSPLRWEGPLQRPHQLMARCSKSLRVFHFEDPVFHRGGAELDVTRTPQGPLRVVPRLPDTLPKADVPAQLQRMIDTLLAVYEVKQCALWYSTPGPLAFTRHLSPELVVYDVTELVPPELNALESELFGRADLVFTGGESLYQAKMHLHRDVYAFPSSVDVPHFARARLNPADPADQKALPHPRLGWCGPIDERLDLALVEQLAALRPQWQLVMVGPVSPPERRLPRAANLHWLGAREHAELPAYLSGWDVAILPFAVSEARKVIAPTRPAELLAAGRPIISTPITDVMNPYGQLNLVKIAADAQGFVAAAEAILREDAVGRVHRADAFLSAMSWDMTWHRMSNAIEEARARKLMRFAATAA